jgi:raffinose/stachyose/melibiose transport system substrate-binding protein
MMLNSKRRTMAAMAGVVVGSLALTACGGGDGGGGGGDAGTLTFLVDNSTDTVAQAESLAEAFTEQNPDISVEIETRPGGSEGDNIVKTRLSTGDMTDLFMYNSGSLFQALNPTQTMVPVEDADWVGSLAEDYAQSVTADDQVYGAPWGSFMAGAMLYHRPTYEELDLEVPKTWDQFMENNAAIEEAGKVPVIESFGETWTSQLFVLGNHHNVAAEEPDFAEDYTAGKAKYADTPAAVRGFEYLQEVYEAGYMNEDFASAKLDDGLRMVAEGEGVHYPILSATIASVAANNPDQVDDVGLMAIPGDDESTYGLTVWAPHSVYIPATTEGDKLEAARKFQAFVASPEGCEAFSAAASPTGPYAVEGCDLPEDVPQVVKDMQTYLDEGKTTLALEFLSPVKGPALEQITVEVGSGIRAAQDGAALYDEDAKKQALQLGLEGW